jgi:redox-sensitive bicupin YhaK (pirin superfamily)
MEILKRDDLPRGGFAGVREHRLVTDKRVFGSRFGLGPWQGLGNFVYLSDARFVPEGQTGLHPHKEIDVISLMVEGRISHEGSMEHGRELGPNDVQVQRAGGQGFTHNEVNPDATENRMIQLWALPEKSGEPARYAVYWLEPARARRVYGGKEGASEFPGSTVIDIVRYADGQKFGLEGEYIAYLVTGAAEVNGVGVGEGDLLRGEDLDFVAGSEGLCIVVRKG